MKVVIQRSKKSNVKINNKTVGEIEKGLVVFLGVGKNDSIEDIDYLVNKIINLRIFEDDEGKMNNSLIDTNGEVLLVSQFTLYAETKKGRRPSFINAGAPDKAEEYYELFKDKLIKQGIILQTGTFQTEMEVNITNDGPVTIIIDTEDHK